MSATTYAEAIWALSQKIAKLQQGLASSRVIGTAIGVVMERYGLDRDRAFEYLQHTSTTNNVTLHEVASEVVDQANRKYQPTTSDRVGLVTTVPEQLSRTPIRFQNSYGNYWAVDSEGRRWVISPERAGWRLERLDPGSSKPTHVGTFQTLHAAERAASA